MIEGLLIGFVVGFLIGGTFGMSSVKDEVEKGKAIYVHDVEYRAKAVK